ncbi:MAG: isoprenyl transferase [Bacteroidales bacterium]|nr:isoprenyl transferase [Bacteroidales bacterium]
MVNLEQIDKNRIPRHVAIIMDGNGRWAQQRGQERSFGHQAGAETVNTISETAARLGVEFLTLYAFSTENWNRPEKEVQALMQLFIESLKEEVLMKNNLRFRIIGDRERLPLDVRECIDRCEADTDKNTGMTLVLALSYSSRWELTHTMKVLAQQVQDGTIRPCDISEESVAQQLNTAFMPNPDLLIRTGGELRLSNYLLWQCAYTELYFCDTYWPDFSANDFYQAIIDYQHRERRYGKTREQIQ